MPYQVGDLQFHRADAPRFDDYDAALEDAMVASEKFRWLFGVWHQKTDELVAIGYHGEVFERGHNEQPICQYEPLSLKDHLANELLFKRISWRGLGLALIDMLSRWAMIWAGAIVGCAVGAAAVGVHLINLPPCHYWTIYLFAGVVLLPLAAVFTIAGDLRRCFEEQEEEEEVGEQY